ncbi:MFS transporter [Streptomyces sp. NPDC093546]|uniref:MFS transporter n=1 Tax=Streptomyces sp. NPDC093546 TaxID=3366040 RepID=UPI0037F7C9FF
MSLLKDLASLPRPARTLLALGAVNNIGSGLVLPFLVVYVHQVNGLGLTTAMHAVSVTSVAVIVGGLHAGRLADRVGARRAAAAHMALSAVGVAGYAVASQGWHFLLASAVWGIGLGGSSAWNALLAASVPDASHPVVFGSSFTLANAAMGIGGLLGGVVAATAHPLSFRLLYAVDAVSYLGVAVLMLVLRGLDPAPSAAAPSAPGAGARPAGYRQVFAHRSFLVVMVVGAALYFASYGQLEAGYPAFLVTHTGVGTSLIAVLFAVNTGGVIAAQVVLHDLVKRWRHTRTVALAGVLWAANWALVLVAAGLPGGAGQLTLLITAMVLFATAETLYATGMPSLVNSLASPELRGRFNAAYGMSTSVGFVTGPLVAGALVTSGSGTPYAAGMAALCAVAPLLLLAVRAKRPQVAAVATDATDPANPADATANAAAVAEPARA